VRIYSADRSDFIEVETPRPLLSACMGARFVQLLELNAPMGEDGVRHPEGGLISDDDLLRLLDMVVGS